MPRGRRATSARTKWLKGNPGKRKLLLAQFTEPSQQEVARVERRVLREDANSPLGWLLRHSGPPELAEHEAQVSARERQKILDRLWADERFAGDGYRLARDLEAGATSAADAALAAGYVMPKHYNGPATRPAVVTVRSATPRGTAAYWLARLQRERPDLAAKVEAGQISAHAAAVEAGYRRR